MVPSLTGSTNNLYNDKILIIVIIITVDIIKEAKYLDKKGYTKCFKFSKYSIILFSQPLNC